MYAQVENSKENKDRAISNSAGQSKEDVQQSYGIVDNRPETVTQRKIQRFLINHSVVRPVQKRNISSGLSDMVQLKFLSERKVPKKEVLQLDDMTTVEMVEHDSALRFTDNRPEAIAQRKLQTAVTNSPPVHQLKSQQRRINWVPPSNDAPIQRVVEPGLGARTEVEKLDGTLVWVIRDVGTGYMVVNPATRETETLRYDELNPKSAAAPKLPKDHLATRFEEHAKLVMPSLKMEAVTGEVDQLFADAVAKIPKPPLPWVGQYSWVALGSYGRNEMCPYSDIELGIIYTIKAGQEDEADDSTIKEHFSKMGTAVLGNMTAAADFITPDTEGNYPGGKGGNSLMGTPSALVRSIAVAHAKEALDARNTMLMDARYLPAPGSHPEPFLAFQQQKSEMLTASAGSQAAINAAQVGLLAVQSLRAGLEDRGRYLNIKKNFRQPLDWALMALCISRGIVDAVGFKARNHALVKEKVIDSSLADLIELTYEMIFMVRIDMHGFHREELDVIDARPNLEEDTGGFTDEVREEIAYYGGESMARRLTHLYDETANKLLPIVEQLLR